MSLNFVLTTRGQRVWGAVSQDALEVMFVTDQPLVDWTDVTLDASEWRVRKPTGDFTDVALTSEDTVTDTEILK